MQNKIKSQKKGKIGKQIKQEFNSGILKYTKREKLYDRRIGSQEKQW